MQIRFLGTADYADTITAMQRFTAGRDPSTEDELWLCQHPPVYTQGVAGRAEHLLDANAGIPVVATNRGGQITYHGPGQVVAYPLIDLQRTGYLVKEYVFRLEEAVIRTLAQWQVVGHRVAGAPGIYVRPTDPFSHAMLAQRPQRRLPGSPPPQPVFDGLGKIAALGIKVQRHCTYHGLALNVDMDLQPYTHINPCGYAGLQTVDLTTIGVVIDWQQAAEALAEELARRLVP
ncbi:lipoyl(octanoyl) transferase LipB [Corticibacter populi]|uniref:Octanoyltransferase n=1 Tax=Corticibacter populi TaxID=1550736 RepID=A0A3M6QZE8_9BURK|nr:lipoyl(octanoyl) transferase LipB [Corticibacter populi]RMX08406.1 lipoyl(octanoyl) transferase LipB [Corticibacter populi]RZS35709.1 lipoyl(octanoyl) transferase [Corticibacter populi]